MSRRVKQSDPNPTHADVYGRGPSIMSGPIVARPCRCCRHWKSWAMADRSHVVCGDAGGTIVRHDAHLGCGHWSRDPGAEGDDLMDPTWFPVVGAGDDAVEVDPVYGVSMLEATVNGRTFYTATYFVAAPDPGFRMPVQVCGHEGRETYLEALRAARAANGDR